MTDHADELERIANAGLDAIAAERHDDELRALVIIQAPCGCLAYTSGGPDDSVMRTRRMTPDAQASPDRSTPTPAPWRAGRYRKRPVVIDAVQLGLAEYADDPWSAWRLHTSILDAPAWLLAAREELTLTPAFASEDYWYFDVATLEGVHRGGPDDWLIRGVEGELYFCKDSIFRATYEPALPTP